MLNITHHNSGLYGTSSYYWALHVAFPFQLLFPCNSRALSLPAVPAASRVTVKCPYWSLLFEAESIHVSWCSDLSLSKSETHRSKWLQNQQTGEFLFFPPRSILKIDWYIEIREVKEALWGLKKQKGCNQSSLIHFSVIIFSFQALLIVCYRACSPYALLHTWFLIYDREKTTVSKVVVLKQFETCHINLLSIWKLSLLFYCIF